MDDRIGHSTQYCNSAVASETPGETSPCGGGTHLTTYRNGATDWDDERCRLQMSAVVLDDAALSASTNSDDGRPNSERLVGCVQNRSVSSRQNYRRYRRMQPIRFCSAGIRIQGSVTLAT